MKAPVNVADMAIKTVWGLTLTEWNRLTEAQRRYCREHVATAPNFQEGSR
jgi:hypothetical protein